MLRFRNAVQYHQTAYNFCQRSTKFPYSLSCFSEEGFTSSSSFCSYDPEKWEVTKHHSYIKVRSISMNMDGYLSPHSIDIQLVTAWVGQMLMQRTTRFQFQKSRDFDCWFLCFVHCILCFCTCFTKAAFCIIFLISIKTF